MNKDSKETFFCKSNMFSLFQNVNPNDILKCISKYEPISIYDLEKKTGVNRNTLYYLLRHLEFVGIIKSKVKINQSNRKVRLIYINKNSNSKLKTPIEKLSKTPGEIQAEPEKSEDVKNEIQI